MTFCVVYVSRTTHCKRSDEEAVLCRVTVNLSVGRVPKLGGRPWQDYYSTPLTLQHTQTTVLLLFWNLSGTTRVSRYQKGKTGKVKTNLDLLEQEIVSVSGICWAICKSESHPRQPCQRPTTQFFTGQMPFLPPNQQRQITEGTATNTPLVPLTLQLLLQPFYGSQPAKETYTVRSREVHP